MNGRLLVWVAVFLALAGKAGASIVVDVGTHDLLANSPGQMIKLYVSGGDQVTGFNLRAMIGDGIGTGSEPMFQSVDFTGGIWGASANTVTGGPISGYQQYAQASVVFNTSVSVPANGLLVTLVIDTTGFYSGSYALSLSSTDIAVDSDFVKIGGAPLAASISNGLINIMAGLSGDANGDGVVDAADYILVKKNMGSAPMVGDPGNGGDFNGDGVVDWDDLQTLISGMGGSRRQVLMIPEPATLALLGLGGLLMLRRLSRSLRPPGWTKPCDLL